MVRYVKIIERRLNLILIKWVAIGSLQMIVAFCCSESKCVVFEVEKPVLLLNRLALQVTSQFWTSDCFQTESSVTA